MKHNMMGPDLPIQLYSSTVFFNGFRASVSADTATNSYTRFYQGETLLITDTSDPDYWSAVPVSNPTRQGQIHRRYVMVGDVRIEPWFFHELPTSVTTSALKRQGPGSFLLRTQKRKFLISHMGDRTVHHTWIHHSESGRYYVDSRRRFSTIQELVDFCRRNKVNGMKLEKYPTRRSIEDLWRIDLKTEDFCAQKEINGQFPWTIKLGTLRNRGQTALYSLKKSATIEDEHWLRNQCEILMCLEHDNLVQLCAVGQENDQLSVVLRLNSTETLSDHLRLHSSKLRTTPEAALAMARDISSGMAYLEKRGIVHGDLTAEHCWLEAGTRRVRIGGFHLARFEDAPVQEKPRCRSGVALPAPELRDSAPTTMSDVWAYGLLLGRIFVGGDARQVSSKTTLEREMSSFPADVADFVENLISSCLYDIAQIRPSFSDIQRRFKRLQEQGQNDVSQPSIEVDPVMFGIEMFEMPDETLDESNTYFDGEHQNQTTQQNGIKFHQLDEESPDTRPNEDSFWSSDEPLTSPEFDVRATAKRQLTFETVTPKTWNTNYVSSDSGCSLSQNNLRRIRSVGDEYQNLRTLCKTYREMFENAKTENDALQRRVEELERRSPVRELEEKLEGIEKELQNSQRECKRLRDRNKMLERSFCQDCKGEKKEVKNIMTQVPANGLPVSSAVLKVESGGTIERGMTQFQRENLERKERLQALRRSNNSLNTSHCSSSSDTTYENDVIKAVTSLEFDDVQFESDNKREKSSKETDNVRSQSDDSAVEFGSFRTESGVSGNFRRVESRKLTHQPEIRAAQKLIRDNLQHSYLKSHSHISTIAEDGVSKVTLF